MQKPEFKLIWEKSLSQGNTILVKPALEGSRTVLNFTISVYASSCHSFFSLFHSLIFFSVYVLHPILPWGCQWIERESKEARTRQKNRLLHTRLYTEIAKSRGESQSPGFYHFCVRQFMQFSLFQSHTLFFYFSIYFLAFHLGVVVIKKRTQRSQNEV